MKALTICQPYPWLILLGEKPVENRSWPTSYRGPLAIHAGKSREWMTADYDREANEAGDPLVFGAIVGTCTLADCLRIADIEAGKHYERYPQLIGNAHCFGHWCWVLTDVKRLAKPIPYRGAQGLFEIPDSVFAEAANV